MSRPESPDDRLGKLAELVLAVTGGKAGIARFAWEFACSCRHVSVPDAINRCIRSHNGRVANGGHQWPRLRPKEQACRELLEQMWMEKLERRASAR